MQPFRYILALLVFASFGFAGSNPAWESSTAGAAPSGRSLQGMAYDEARGEMVLFGGFAGSSHLFGDTWTWNGSQWQQKSVSVAPAPRIGHAMAYDAARGQIVLFGGEDPDKQILYNDTWVWDGAQWTQKTVSNPPSKRTWNAMVYDGARQQIVLFGGFNGSYASYNDTWVWDGINWTRKTVNTSPVGRAGHAMAYDAVQQEVVLFGGSGDDNYKDTWTWDGSAWQRKSPAVSPSARFFMAMAFDPLHEDVVLFGGSNDSSYMGDTWTWNGGNWTKKSPVASPVVRSGHTMAYSAALKKIVLFGGGIDGPAAFYSDTWTWNGGDLPAPAILSVYPVRGLPGTSFPNFSIFGSNFKQTSTFVFSGQGISIDSYGSRASTKISASITIAANAALGKRDITVQNPDGQTVTLLGAFELTSTCTPIAISQQPEGSVIQSGGIATVRVTASGMEPLSYQWYEGAQGDTGKPVGGNSLQFTTPSLGASTGYWVRISNPCGSMDSNVALITVLESRGAGVGKSWIGIGPFGGIIRALVIDPQNPFIIYAGTYNGGVFKSTNGGTAWNAVNSGFKDLGIASLAVDPLAPSTLYAGMASGSIYKSTDSGGSWNKVYQGMQSYIDQLIADPQTSGTVYALIQGHGIIKSTNAGGSWSIVSAKIYSFNILCLALDPVHPSIMYAGSNGYGVFKSIDGGGSWRDSNGGLSSTNIPWIMTDPKNSSTIFLISSIGEVSRSTDGGVSWKTVMKGIDASGVFTLAIDPKNPGILYAGSSYGGFTNQQGGIYKTSNNGDTWQLSNSGISKARVNILAVDPQNPSTIYAGTNLSSSPLQDPGDGIFKSDNSGLSWSRSSGGLNDVNVYAIAVDPKDARTIYAGVSWPESNWRYKTMGTSGGIFKTKDAGKTWNPVNSGFPLYPDPTTAIAVDPSNSSIVYVSMPQYGIYKTTNGGNSWSAVNSGLSSYSLRTLAISPASPATIFAGAYGAIYKTTNGGQSWNYVSACASGDVEAIVPDTRNPGTFYAGLDSGGVCRSTDWGNSWFTVNAIMSGEKVRALSLASDSTLYAGTDGDGVFKSINGGAAWTKANTGLGALSVYALVADPQNSMVLYAGTNGGGVFLSVDGAASWKAINTGLWNPYVNVLALARQNGASLYAGTTGGGIFGSYSLSQETLSLSANGTASTSSMGPANEAIAGYASVTVKTGAAPYGAAVFSFRQNDVVISEAGIPASPPTVAARFFVDSRSNVSAGGGMMDIATGFAAVNPNSKIATLQLKLSDSAGTTLAQGSIQLAAGGYIAKFLEQLAPNFVLPDGFAKNGLGTLSIASDQPVSILALRLTRNQRNDLLLTSTPIADLSKTASSGPLSFPQIADGGGYQTTLILMNTSNAVQSGVVRFFKDDGSPLSMRMISAKTTAAQIQYSIQSGGFLWLQTDGTPSSANTGWAQLVPDSGTTAPMSAAIFGLAVSGTLVTETGVPAVAATSHARIYIDKSGGHDTGLAIDNPGNAAIQVTAAAFQKDGTMPAGKGSVSINLPVLGHMGMFVGQLIEGLPDGFTGVLDLSSSSPFGAVTLRSLINARGDFLLTTLPVADVNQPAPSPLIFPQIADGGGYQTQIILLSTSGAASECNIGYFNGDGSPAEIGGGRLPD
jgi:photosystem II stability/assembly factor-like uncharacterized protein